MYNLTISKATLRNYPMMKVITSVMEAMVVVVVENARAKWYAMNVWLGKNPGQKLPQHSKDNKDLDIFKSKWSHQDGGQQPFGGWDPDAMDWFIDLKDKICKVRALEETATYEEKALSLLRAERKMDQIEADKASKKKSNSTKKCRRVETFDEVME